MPGKDDAGLYAAFKAKDARFDGRFFVGISSTGIYCRPVCRARQPKEENCHFYPTAAQAEQAGYRPCMLCRPEQAPGTSVTDATADLAYRAARMLEQSCGSGQSLAETAEKLGCSDRHLRRVFAEEYNVSPVQYQQTCRLLLAKNLLTDTRLSVLEVAMAAGFGSLRRFNDLFKRHYRMTPTALRKECSAEKPGRDSITLALGYRPPYRWEEMLSFLAGRAITGVETVRDGEYLRTVAMETGDAEVTGWVKVGHNPRKSALEVTISESLLPVLPQVLARVRHLFDLHCDPETVAETLESMNSLRPGLFVPGIRVPGCFDPFEMAVRAVLGQQITVKAAGTLAARICESYGVPIDTGVEGLTRRFPTAGEVAAMGDDIKENFGVLGITSARSDTILELARGLSQGGIRLDLPPEPMTETETLLRIRGIGSWTAGYIAMRAMEWPDTFLETDAGVKNALPGYTSTELLRLAEAWRPWRSYATVSLWNSLREGS